MERYFHMDTLSVLVLVLILVLILLLAGETIFIYRHVYAVNVPHGRAFAEGINRENTERHVEGSPLGPDPQDMQHMGSLFSTPAYIHHPFHRQDVSAEVDRAVCVIESATTTTQSQQVQETRNIAQQLREAASELIYRAITLAAEAAGSIQNLSNNWQNFLPVTPSFRVTPQPQGLVIVTSGTVHSANSATNNATATSQSVEEIEIDDTNTISSRNQLPSAPSSHQQRATKVRIAEVWDDWVIMKKK